MRYTASSLMGLALFLGIGLTWGAAPPTLEELAAAIERVRTGPDGERVVVGHISRKLAVSVEALRAQHAQTGLGWGELLIANLHASKRRRRASKRCRVRGQLGPPLTRLAERVQVGVTRCDLARRGRSCGDRGDHCGRRRSEEAQSVCR